LLLGVYAVMVERPNGAERRHRQTRLGTHGLAAKDYRFACHEITLEAVAMGARGRKVRQCIQLVRR